MRFITLATVNDIFQAQALGRALEEEGIQFIEANEHTATILPHLRQGIQIRVQEIDFLKAKVVHDKFFKKE